MSEAAELASRDSAKSEICLHAVVAGSQNDVVKIGRIRSPQLRTLDLNGCVRAIILEFNRRCVDSRHLQLRDAATGRVYVKEPFVSLMSRSQRDALYIMFGASLQPHGLPNAARIGVPAGGLFAYRQFLVGIINGAHDYRGRIAGLRYLIKVEFKAEYPP